MPHEKRLRRRRVAIIGGSGYGGSELLRILLFHPQVDVVAVTSRRYAGQPVASIHRHLYGVTDLAFTDPDPERLARSAEVVVLAVPHGESQTIVGRLADARLVIDLSADFRVRDAAAYQEAYGAPHSAPDLLDGWVYGLTEFHRPELQSASRIANPGCFATATLLALVPLARAGLLASPVVLDGKTGSSGSGEQPKATTHHPERAHAFRAYRPLRHPHIPEIAQELARHSPGGYRLAFVPHSAPMVRGIFATAYVFPRRDLAPEQAREVFMDCYRGERFVRIVDESPDAAVVAGSNFADIAVTADDGVIVAMVAIDNLVKGMAGQAVQNLNVACRWPESTGLEFPGTRP